MKQINCKLLAERWCSEKCL